MSENREAGWYWCKDSYGDDLPLYWCVDRWLTSASYSHDSEYSKQVMEVGERIPTPDEIPDPVIMPREVYELLCAGKPDRIDRAWSHGQLSAAPKPGGDL